LVIGGLFLRSKNHVGSSSVEVLDNATPSQSVLGKSESGKIAVDVSGGVIHPGVYHLSFGSRVEDALIASGGLSSDADRSWVDKNLNRAAKLTDGQKIFVPLSKNSNVAQSESMSNGNLININAASISELDSLPGIGQVYGQSMIDNRPYSDVSDLVSKKVLKQSVYDKIKDKVTVY